MDVVHRSTVTDEQIDALGHMNVRWYGANAEAATIALLARAELVRPGQALRTYDLYTRHHREQMAGAHLAVRSGVVDIRPRSVTLYHELYNEGSGVLAATFLRRVALADPAGTFAHDRVATVEVPEAGRPRSVRIDDDPLADAPAVDLLVERQLAMRHPRLIGADDVGADGVVPVDGMHELLWGGEPIDPRPWEVHDRGPQGQPVNMAVLETRMVLGRPPRLGDRIQAFGATVAVGEKTSTRRQWVIDLAAGAPLLVSTSVAIALDLDARRAMQLTDRMRSEAERNLHPDLA